MPMKLRRRYFPPSQTHPASLDVNDPRASGSQALSQPPPSVAQATSTPSAAFCTLILPSATTPHNTHHTSLAAHLPGQNQESNLNATFPPPPDLTSHISRQNDQYIAGGGFGDVYRCWYHDSSPKEVAVKAFRFSFALDGDTNNKSMLRRELGIWRRLNHINVVPFLGIAYGFGPDGAMSLVSLWMPNGTLHHFLERYNGNLGVGHRLQLLLDIASGLHYLHSFPIVHGDLNGNNVLLGEDYIARLGDFGHACLVDKIPEALTYLQRSTTRPGALRWTAPEQISEEPFNLTTKCDIYSFGCIALQGCALDANIGYVLTFLQVLSGKQPWSEVRRDVAVALRLEKGHNPGRPDCQTLYDSHWNFIQQCWLQTKERPPAEVIISTVQQFLSRCPQFRPLRDTVTSWSSQVDTLVNGPSSFPINPASQSNVVAPDMNQNTPSFMDSSMVFEHTSVSTIPVLTPADRANITRYGHATSTPSAAFHTSIPPALYDTHLAAHPFGQSQESNFNADFRPPPDLAPHMSKENVSHTDFTAYDLPPENSHSAPVIMCEVSQHDCDTFEHTFAKGRASDPVVPGLRLKRRTITQEPDLMEPQGIKNVIVFGESGVGKSSLINLIAGRKVTETSSGALGYTLEYERHLVDLDDQQFAIWDTAGLDEGTQAFVPAEKAVAYLKQLLNELAKNNGIDLLVYCVRGTRVRSALLTNYHIFYSAICRKKVPIAIVITGLENQERNMETWWYNHEHQFSSRKMFFDSHACVTTLELSIENATLKERREMSKAAVIKMITSTCRTQQWKPPERSWVKSAYSDIRAMLSPKDGSSSHLATIIMCEAYRDSHDKQAARKHSISFQNPIALSLSLNPLSFRSPVAISDAAPRSKLPFECGIKCTPERLYRVYQVSSEGAEENTKKVTVVKRSADLLIFCVKTEHTESRSVKSQWEHFNLTYGGDLSPQVIVVVGAPDQSFAEEWWRNAIGETPSMNGVHVAYWPKSVTAPSSQVGEARRRLQSLINDHCIDCSTVSFGKDEKIFRRSLYLDMSSLTSLWGKLESVSEEDGPPTEPEQDILMELGVWAEIPEHGPSTASIVFPKESRGNCF